MIKGTWEQRRGRSHSLSASAPLQPCGFFLLSSAVVGRRGGGPGCCRAGQGVKLCMSAVLCCPSCSPRAAQGPVPALCCTTPAAWGKDELKGRGRGAGWGSGAASSTTPLGVGGHPAPRSALGLWPSIAAAGMQPRFPSQPVPGSGLSKMTKPGAAFWGQKGGHRSPSRAVMRLGGTKPDPSIPLLAGAPARGGQWGEAPSPGWGVQESSRPSRGGVRALPPCAGNPGLQWPGGL